PHIWQDNSFHDHFIYPDLVASDNAIKEQIEAAFDYFNALHKACWDAGKEFIDEWKKVPRKAGTIRDVFVKGAPKDFEACQVKAQDIVFRLSEFEIDKRIISDFELPKGEGTIDIGQEAVSGPGWSHGYTTINLSNPANASGEIDTFLTYFSTNGSGVFFGTFYGSSPNYTSRDVEDIGSVVSGDVRTFTGLHCDVETDDFAGMYVTSGAIVLNNDGIGVYYKAGDQFGAGQQSYTLYGEDEDGLSLYGTGTEAGAEYYHGLKVQSVGEL
ncbi:unnamed protein product, partial [marine sediment metagenome]